MRSSASATCGETSTAAAVPRDDPRNNTLCRLARTLYPETISAMQIWQSQRTGKGELWLVQNK